MLIVPKERRIHKCLEDRPIEHAISRPTKRRLLISRSAVPTIWFPHSSDTADMEGWLSWFKAPD